MLEAEETANDYVGLVKQFREDMLKAGYCHANEPGDLVSQDGTTWISTTYTHGEYSIYAWRRESGHGELGEAGTRVCIRVTPRSDPAAVTKVAADLKRWARRPRKGAAWPPKSMHLPSLHAA